MQIHVIHVNSWHSCQFMTFMSIHDIHVNSWHSCQFMTFMSIHSTHVICHWTFPENSVKSQAFGDSFAVWPKTKMILRDTSMTLVTHTATRHNRLRTTPTWNMTFLTAITRRHIRSDLTFVNSSSFRRTRTLTTCLTLRACAPAAERSLPSKKQWTCTKSRATDSLSGSQSSTRQRWVELLGWCHSSRCGSRPDDGH
jgi:hypothetical protein